MTPGCAAKQRPGGTFAPWLCGLVTLATLLAACGEVPPPVPALPPLTPDYGVTVSAEQRAWSEQVWPKVVSACGGLRRYREDLSAAAGASRFVADYFEGPEAALVAVIQVAEQPSFPRLREFAAQGHRCEFAMDYPKGDAVQIARRWCQQLCLDRPIESAGQDLRLGLK